MQNRQSEDKFAQAREQMVAFDLKGRDITDAGVLRVMSEIRREEFISGAYRRQTYSDGPLPIGMGQTISQPYIVALMTQILKVNRSCEVLEIGTGSGYQTAILGRLAKKVYTIERFAELSKSAMEVLGRLEISNVEFYIGDGSCGWPEERTFDRIMVTASIPQIPESLKKQLADGGLMAAPVGPTDVQQLVVCEKKTQKIAERVICDVHFIRLVGKYGFAE